MIKTKDEILNHIKERFGEDTSDETLSFLEDVSDTITDLETKATGMEDWKTKYEENDKEWREKYRDRFFNHQKEDEDEFEEVETKEIKTFDDLFTQEV